MMKIKAAMRIAALLAVCVGVWMLIPTLTQAQTDRNIQLKPGTRQLEIQRIPTLRPRLGPRITFEKGIKPELLKNAASMKLYRLQPPKFGRESFDGLAQRLFNGSLRGQMVTADNVIARADANNPSNFMLLDPTSGLLSINRGMADLIDERPGQLPNEEVAVNIARDFLRQHDLGPGNENEMILAHIGRIRSQSFDPRTGNEGPMMDQMLTVYFSRIVEGVHVIGGGSKMIVQIGDDGMVAGAGIRWRELGDATRAGEKGIRSAEQVQSDIISFLRREQKQASDIKITQTGLFYYDDGGNYMQPAIGYEAMVTTGELQVRYLGQAAILINPPERVGPAPLSETVRRMIQMGKEGMRLMDGQQSD